MVLHHVAQGPRLVVVSPAMLDANLLGHDDLQLLDVAAIPNRLEEAVGEAKGQDVLHRLLAQVMIDPIDLRLGQQAGQPPVQFPGALQIVAERLFNDQSIAGRIVGEMRLLKLACNQLHERRRHGRVKHSLHRTVPLLLKLRQPVAQGCKQLWIIEIAGQIGNRAGKCLPLACIDRSATTKFVQRRTQIRSIGIVGQFLAINTDDCKPVGGDPLIEK